MTVFPRRLDALAIVLRNVAHSVPKCDHASRLQLAPIPHGDYTIKGMWSVYESRAASKALDSAPPQVLEKYEFWVSVVKLSGPKGLRQIRGFNDEALGGEWRGYRSSRLNLQWRIIYQVDASMVSVQVVRVSPHDDRR